MVPPAARPLAALLLLALWMGVTAMTGRPVPEGQGIGQVAATGILRQVALAALLVSGAALLLRWEGLGLGLPRRGSLLHLWLPVLYLLLIGTMVAAVGLPPAPVVAILAVNMLMVGLSEELMFRGILWTGLRERLSFWTAAGITSVLFGAVHVLNVLGTGHLGAALLQSLAATLLGLSLLGLRLRTGSLWPAILFHAAWNLGLLIVGLNQPPLDPGVEIPVAAGAGLLLGLLPLGLHGLWLLRTSARGEAPALAAGPRNPWGTPLR